MRLWDRLFVDAVVSLRRGVPCVKATVLRPWRKRRQNGGIVYHVSFPDMAANDLLLPDGTPQAWAQNIIKGLITEAREMER